MLADGGRDRRGPVVAAPVTCRAMEIVGVEGLPEINPGDDLAALIAAAADIRHDDIVVVTSKIVSKAEGRTVELDTVEPSGFATEWSGRC
jgi:coenzyme F420-0:L-glutamate ligase / coenzyme F420-1:gamma-L-glutamate ligase